MTFISYAFSSLTYIRWYIIIPKPGLGTRETFINHVRKHVHRVLFIHLWEIYTILRYNEGSLQLQSCVCKKIRVSYNASIYLIIVPKIGLGIVGRENKYRGRGIQCILWWSMDKKLSIFNPNSRFMFWHIVGCLQSRHGLLNFHYRISRVLWFVIHGIKYKNYKEHST